MKTESQIQREICDWLDESKYFFWRHNQVPVMGRAMPKYTPKGIADILVVVSGQLFAIEVKRPGSDDEREKNGRAVRAGMLSAHQAQWGADLCMAGGKFRCVRSLEEAKQFLGR
jgi:hypothetical protein